MQTGHADMTCRWVVHADGTCRGDMQTGHADVTCRLDMSQCIQISEEEYSYFPKYLYMLDLYLT